MFPLVLTQGSHYKTLYSHKTSHILTVRQVFDFTGMGALALEQINA